jgi:hypothetical protein
MLKVGKQIVTIRSKPGRHEANTRAANNKIKTLFICLVDFFDRSLMTLVLFVVFSKKNHKLFFEKKSQMKVHRSMTVNFSQRILTQQGTQAMVLIYNPHSQSPFLPICSSILSHTLQNVSPSFGVLLFFEKYGDGEASLVSLAHGCRYMTQMRILVF